jgi:hypothetical protein
MQTSGNNLVNFRGCRFFPMKIWRFSKLQTQNKKAGRIRPGFSDGCLQELASDFQSGF